MLQQLCSYSSVFWMRFGTQWLQSCLSSCRASLVAHDHRVWVCAYTFWEAQLSWYTQSLGTRRMKNPQHHWTKQLTTKHQNVHRRARDTEIHITWLINNTWFVQNKNIIYSKCFLDFTFQRDKMRLCLTTNDMYRSWICWHDPLQFYAKMGHLSREETIILKWLSALRGMTCLGRCPFSPSPCLVLQSPGLC